MSAPTAEHEPHDTAGPATARERVFAAADALLAEDEPVTVTTVRERAGCSNATATSHLRAWRAARAAAEAEAARLPDLPRSVELLVQRGVTGLWAEAVRRARQEHAEESAGLRADREAAREDAARLARAVDDAVAEHEADRDRLAEATQQVQLLTGRLEQADAERDRADGLARRAAGQADELREALQQVRAEADVLRRDLAATTQSRAEASEQRAAARADAEARQVALDEARSALEALRTELRGCQDERAAAVAELAGARAAAERRDQELITLRDERDEARARASETAQEAAAQAAARARAEGELAGLRSTLSSTPEP
ncbi:hypothetical protein GCM10023216_17340 [Isoptericola chiayiensis]|uniref:KfrA N-terminal DNA-binding domain-containing protein n=1 Tax=Isoptericola chiayiensis TaxID=579446 RepID=A0ABP8YIC6_9MICO|nr:DNA-binding protein [Isoptericola chiayiensis]NOV99962.1 chromosome segregation ATPase [Isoptericola chiayiensis]